MSFPFRSTPLTRDEWSKDYAPSYRRSPDELDSMRMCLECKANCEKRRVPWPPCKKDDLNREFQFDLMKMTNSLDGLDESEILEIQFETDPVLWSAYEFQFDGKPWQPFWYQQIFMRCTASQKVARWGRRSGKSECMIALCLWYAKYRIGSKGDDRQYDIHVFTNSEDLAKKHWREFKKFIEAGRTLSTMIVSKEKGKLLELDNNVTIHFNVLSSKQLGQDAQLIWFDEAAFYESEEAFGQAQALIFSNPDIPMIMTSNSSGFRGKFYEFANLPDTYELHLPAYVNPEWRPSMEMFARRSWSEVEYERMVIAGWGTAESGVFKPHDIERQLQLYPYSSEKISTVKAPGKFRVLGNDWNEGSNGVHFVVVEFDANPKKDWNTGKPIFKVVHKRVVSGHEYNHEVAVDIAYQLLMQWNCDAAYLDHGGGGNQNAQRLKIRLMKEGKTTLANRLFAIDMGKNWDVPDIGGGTVAKRAKNLIVGTCQILSENHQLAFPIEEAADETNQDKSNNIIPQMRHYKVERTDQAGRAIYSRENDHTLTAWMLAVYGCVVEFTDMIAPNTQGYSYLVAREEMPSEEIEKVRKEEAKKKKLENEWDEEPKQASGNPRFADLPGWRTKTGRNDRTGGFGGSRKRTW